MLAANQSLALLLLLATQSIAAPQEYFAIRVIDDSTERGVPLVELRTVNNIRYYTDSAGYVAFHEPGLMNTTVFFHVKSHGYEFKKDRFGYAGRRLKVSPGGSAELRVTRVNIAELLYRMTGAGIYRDSKLLGISVPIDAPLINARVFGSDSVVNVIHQEKIYWFWGDTNRPSYPLGNFHVPGATSELPGQGVLDPDVGVNLQYFKAQDGFAKQMAPIPGKGPTWINGLISLRDGDKERLFTGYVKVEPPLKIYERGIAEFDETSEQFRKLKHVDLQSSAYPSGHPFIHGEDGAQFVYFGNPFPVVRVPATVSALLDEQSYEFYTCVESIGSGGAAKIEKSGDRAVFRWRKFDDRTSGKPFSAREQQRLIREKLITPEQGLYRLFDADGKPIAIHGGSVCWNDYREKWIMIGLQSFGTSALGEVWYSESDRMEGPWTHATKIATHDKYSFYNPKQHPMFDQDGGRTIYFEGTYTNMFSGNSDQTPRYNYNQMMYKLDLADDRLH